jgi:hypothetical protein
MLVRNRPMIGLRTLAVNLYRIHRATPPRAEERAAEVCALFCRKRGGVDMANKPSLDACFSDWKHFCFVLREIASV